MTGLRRTVVFGLGRVGTSVALRLRAQGALHGAWTRSSERAQALRERWEVEEFAHAWPDHASLAGAGLLLFCVPDDALQRCIEALPADVKARNDLCWLHSSGVRGVEPFRDAGVVGPVGTWHPLYAFPSDPDHVSAEGAFFALSGDPPAVMVAEALVALFGGASGLVPDEARAAYHLAAVIAGNGVYGLLWSAQQILERAGVHSEDLQRGMALLAAQSAGAVGRDGLEAAMTGPFARGDASTVLRHRTLMRSGDSGQERLYLGLAAPWLALARARGLADDKVAALESVLADWESASVTQDR